MQETEIYEILKDVVTSLATEDPSIPKMPDSLDPTRSLDELGLDLTVLPEVRRLLQARLQGKEMEWDFLYDQDLLQGADLGSLIKSIQDSLRSRIPNPILVYVDDEEENLFVFKRKFDKSFRLKTFSDSLQALEFIRKNEDVALVVTDEVMPKMGGNALCDEVHKTRPYLRFVLITGNPNQDEDLMYRTLRHNRFYEFIQKPLDMQNKGAQYESLFRKLISGQ